MKEKLYIAYGSNLNLNQMATRCPAAVPVGKTKLHGWQLTFRGRGVATLEKLKGAKVPVGIWQITDECEKALDGYEGVPTDYRKEIIEIKHKRKKVKAIIYLMNAISACMPSSDYLQIIREGYKDMGLDSVYLKQALEYTQKRVK